MLGKMYYYPIRIKEVDLDVYAHVNNAKYLEFFEEARWDYINQNGYGYPKILETGFGPVVLEVTMRYLKELRLGDSVTIETHLISYEGKIGKLSQNMVREKDVCCTSEFTIALFDLKSRKLVAPTPEWWKGLGLH